MRVCSKIFRASPEAIAESARLIRVGKLVAFPTETVYGLGADALNPKAVARIFDAKKRPRFNPLIVHVAAQEEAVSLWTEVPKAAKLLMARFWPGPLTLVLPKSRRVPDIVTAGLDTVAIRIPAHPVALELLRLARRPIAAPSANRFGHSSPTTAEAVRKDLGNKVALILDAGRCPVGMESTVVSLVEKAPKILRIGGTPLEQLEAVLGRKFQLDTRRKPGKMESPGMLERHYAPTKPLFILAKDAGMAMDITARQSRNRTVQSSEFRVRSSVFGVRSSRQVSPNSELRTPNSLRKLCQKNTILQDCGTACGPEPLQPLSRTALLAFGPVEKEKAFAAVQVLSQSGSLVEAAANYFEALRRLEESDANVILAQEVPRKGLGLAIMDRLERAAAGVAVVDDRASGVIRLEYS